MPATGQRGSTPVAPMNRTGKIYQAQLREQQAKDALKDTDIPAIQRQARHEGFRQGYRQGFEEGAEWLREQIVNAGINVDEILSLYDDDQDQAVAV